MKNAVSSSVMLIFILVAVPQLIAQNKKLWEEGPLTWEDFRGEPFRASPHASELNYQFGYSTSQKKLNDTTLYAFETRNYITPDISWVKEEYKLPQLLLYNQVLFNIMEIHRRQLQYGLNRLDNFYHAEEKYRTEYAAFNQITKRFQEETNFGTDAEALEYWDNRISQELSLNPMEVIPPLREGNFGYGFNLGVGTGVFTGTLGDHFTHPFNFVFGFDLAFKNTMVFINGTLAVNKIKSEFQHDGFTLPKDLRSNVAIMDFSLGQAIIDNNKHKLVPFAGFGLLEFSIIEKEEAFEDFRMIDTGIIFGINYEYKIHKVIRLVPSPFGGGSRSKAEGMIRARLYITSCKFEEFKGSSVNLTVGYNFFGRSLKVAQ